MNPLDTMRARKGRVLLIGYTGWRQLAGSVLPDYADLLDLQVIEQPFDEGLRTATRMARSREVDVFMSTNLMAEELRVHLDRPVVPIRITGFEIMRALTQAAALGERVALISFGRINEDVERLGPLLKLEVRQAAYMVPGDIEKQFKQLRRDGIEVVIGSGVVVDLARQYGLTGIFVHGEPSMRKALDEAVELIRLMRSDAAKRERLDAIVRHLKEGVVAVDMDERVQLINPAMEQFMGVDGSAAVGRKLGELTQDLRLDDTLRRGVADLGQVEQLGIRTVVASRIPIREQGVQTGAVLTLQDAQAVQRADRNIRVQAKQRQFKARYRLDQIAGEGSGMALARTKAGHYALSESTVLITGESGTGKELFAQGIHNASRRCDEAFVAVNCPAIPENLLESELFGYDEGAFTGARRGGKLGLFEAAHGGTIFLDEIGDMPIMLQTRLLRVLQEREILRVGGYTSIPVDVRVIAATNVDLHDQIANGSFRKDLFYRLNILHLELPPLRQRREDVPALAAMLARALLKRTGSSLRAADFLPQLMPALQRHSWPGNVREMENVIERVIAFYTPLGGVADPETLKFVAPELFAREPEVQREFGGPVALRALSRASELAHAREVLSDCGGDHAMAARQLGISRTTLWRKLREG